MKPWPLTALLLLGAVLALVAAPPLRRVAVGAARATAFTRGFLRVQADLGPDSAAPPPEQLATLDSRPAQVWWLTFAAFSASPISPAAGNSRTEV